MPYSARAIAQRSWPGPRFGPVLASSLKPLLAGLQVETKPIRHRVYVISEPAVEGTSQQPPPLPPLLREASCLDGERLLAWPPRRHRKASALPPRRRPACRTHQHPLT